MKLSIDREELQRALARLQAIVERRGTLPILANVLIEARDDGLRLAATDLEVGVRSIHEATVEEPGSITLGAKKLFEIVRELDGPEVGLALDDDARVRIEGGGARFSLLAISAEEYPTLPSPEGAEFVGLESSLLAEMIDRTLFATSTDETRYNLNGVFIELTEEGKVSFVATDGHRMSRVEKGLPARIPFPDGGIIVPRKGMSEIRKLCDEAEGEVELAMNDNFLLVRSPGLVLSCRLIDGEFPNYRQVIPSEQPIRVLIDRERLSHAVRRIALVANERAGGFQLVLEDGQMEVSASNPDLGEAREQVPIEYTGDRFQTGFNARYVLDALSAMGAKEVYLEARDELAAATLRPADDLDHVAVIMPMRL